MIERKGKMEIGHKSVTHDNIVYVGGLIASDLSLDMKGQTAEICKKFDAILAEAGTDKSKLLNATIFVTDLPARPKMNEAWTEWLPADVRPARATIGVADLGKNVLIEVTAVAA